MTREEAWRRTKGCLYDVLSGEEADEIIKALEQQPNDDCISREEAIKQCGFGMTHLLIADCLRRLPSVTPKARWIPCSERLPELHEASPLLKKFVNKVSDEVLVTIEDKKNGTRIVSSKCYLWDNLWHGDIFDWLKASKCDFEIIAWIPLPQPYKESEDKE